jgi:hypothetical protein
MSRQSAGFFFFEALAYKKINRERCQDGNHGRRPGAAVCGLDGDGVPRGSDKNGFIANAKNLFRLSLL